MDASQGNNNKLPSNLPQLQNLIKRDPISYAEEFERQYSVYSATLVIFEQNPTVQNDQLHELVMFMAQVAQCYPKVLNEFPQELMTLLKRHASVLHPEMRMSLVKALVLLRNKNLLSPTDLHILFFQLLRCQDKHLRKFLQQHIVTDIKNLNSKSKNMKLNKELQNFMYEMLKAKHAVAAKTSLNVMIELYNKKIWNDAKTVNILTTACFHKVTKIMVAAIKFFVGKDDDDDAADGNKSDSDSDDEDEQSALKAAVMAYRVNKKTKKRKQKKMQKVKNIVKKNQKDKTTKVNIDFSALHLIHDPQDMAERLYRKLEGMNERFEVKLLTMNLISRLIGIHKVYLPNFYPMLQRYLYPHQREVTKVMVFVAQAAHDEVPPDELEPVVRCLANNFVTERYSNEVMAMGLNAIRELCARNPYGMPEDLLQDLAQYKTHKDKGVSIAAKSIIILFRDKNPLLLNRKDRGAPTELKAEEKQQVFGGGKAKSFIPGAEILSFKVENEDNDNTDSEGEDWIDVDHPEIYMPGSDDEEDEGKENENEENNEKTLTTKEAVKEVMKLTAEERAERASDIVTSRFLTDQDFAKIAAVQAAKYVEKFSLNKKNKNSKRKLDVIEERQETGELVPLKNIEMIYKKRKHDKEARMGTVLAGREGREKFNQRKGKMNPNASTTNKQKKKGKNFMMMKHKVKGKQKKSFRDKQMKLRNSLLKQQKFKS